LQALSSKFSYESSDKVKFQLESNLSFKLLRNGLFMFREESSSVSVEEGEVYDVTIQDIARQGDGIARIEGFVIFVPGTKVGDEVRIKIERVLPKYGFASIFK
jgi:predicted RNA-binding protein with TRAM domain